MDVTSWYESGQGEGLREKSVGKLFEVLTRRVPSHQFDQLCMMHEGTCLSIFTKTQETERAPIEQRHRKRRIPSGRKHVKSCNNL